MLKLRKRLHLFVYTVPCQASFYMVKALSFSRCCALNMAVAGTVLHVLRTILYSFFSFLGLSLCSFRFSLLAFFLSWRFFCPWVVCLQVCWCAPFLFRLCELLSWLAKSVRLPDIMLSVLVWTPVQRKAADFCVFNGWVTMG